MSTGNLKKIQKKKNKDIIDDFCAVRWQRKSGQEALEVLKKNAGKVDIVLLDLIMPGLSGHEVL